MMTEWQILTVALQYVENYQVRFTEKYIHIMAGQYIDIVSYRDMRQDIDR